MAKQDEKPPASVTREQFRADPGGVVSRAIREGRVVITDAQGRVVSAVSAPMDRLPVSFD